MTLASSVCAEEYWVYIRLEDRSGVTTEKDAGRSKKGDVIAALPVTGQFTPSEKEKQEYLIFKADLTDTERRELLEPLTETVGNKTVIRSYRKKKLNISNLGVTEKKGMVPIWLNNVEFKENSPVYIFGNAKV